MSCVLVADDEPAICRVFTELLERAGHRALVAADGHQALELVRSEQPDAAFLDVRMPGLDGLEALRQLQQLAPDLPVVIMTAYGSMETALSAVRNGAFDYLGKPLELDRVRSVLERVLRAAREHAELEHARPPAPTSIDSVPTLIGQGPAMQQLYKLMALLTDNDMPVLIHGESGVGKELVARGLHRYGIRREEPFVAVNCGAIPADLLESELFGHVRGAFTGAVETRSGKLAAAGAGTLLLDEVGELPPLLQVKLLRVLQERCFEPVGEHRPQRLRARILAATNRDLPQEIAAGRFREDLYHRLNTISLHIPPLRQRREDIPLLARHFLARAAGELERPAPALAPDALDALVRHPWPGNVRELEHLLRRSLLLTPTPVLTAADLAFVPSEAGAADTAETGLDAALTALTKSAAAALDTLLLATPASSRESPYGFLVEHLERTLVCEALRRCDNNQVAASRLLGLHRSTLRKKAGLDKTDPSTAA
jgi:DNA-binding NtrC family response regulator